MLRQRIVRGQSSEDDLLNSSILLTGFAANE